MKYAYEDLSSEQFETLIVLLCQRLLGISVQGFAKGPDGGRDAKFVGKAELHPSQAAPWGELKARHSKAQRREAAIGCHILNRMAELGRPSSYALGR